MTYDIAIVGAGILGLAHALAASRLGLSAIVLDRDQRAVGASIRNFGFVTVTGQQDGDCWRRAMRSRDIWDEIAPPAGISVLQHGLAVVARRPEAATVLDAFSRHPSWEKAANCSPRPRAAPASPGSPVKPRRCSTARMTAGWNRAKPSPASRNSSNAPTA